MVERKNQFNDLFKMQLYADDKYNQLLGDDKRDRGPSVNVFMNWYSESFYKKKL